MPSQRSPISSKKVSYSDAPPRPPNSFIMWRSAELQLVKQGKISCYDQSRWNNMSAREKDIWAEKAKEAKADHQKKHPDYQYGFYRGIRHKGEEGKREAQARIERAAEVAKNGKSNSQKRLKSSQSNTNAACAYATSSSSFVDNVGGTLMDSHGASSGRIATVAPGTLFGNYDPFDQRAAEARYFRGDPEMVDDDERFKPGPLGFPWLGRQFTYITGCPSCDISGYNFAPHACGEYKGMTSVEVEKKIQDDIEYKRLQAELLQPGTFF